VDHFNTKQKTTTTITTSTTTSTMDKIEQAGRIGLLEEIETSRDNLPFNLSRRPTTTITSTTLTTTSKTESEAKKSTTPFDLNAFLKFEDIDHNWFSTNRERDSLETSLSPEVPTEQKPKLRPAALEPDQSVKYGRPTQSAADLKAVEDDVEPGHFIQDICTDDRLAVCATVGIVVLFLCATGLYAVLYTAYQVHTFTIRYLCKWLLNLKVNSRWL
jgi:hypothetical protein